MQRDADGQDRDLETGKATPMKTYKKGEEHEVHQGLAQDFVNMGAAKHIDAKSDPKPKSAKGGAPEDKRGRGARSNK